MIREETVWSFRISTYPGVLLGIRTYDKRNHNSHVLYFPFIEFELIIYK